ncbi:uncharacterized protein LOC9652708 [Selaginella moellendorffii]|nr:uncharacterized protein LOC9652708 [Selaginella moellendorffii]|eukprot:XP_002966134.2 uncharacterized protein LOC9652708 [Selaginella moellendorffii]
MNHHEEIPLSHLNQSMASSSSNGQDRDEEALLGGGGVDPFEQIAGNKALRLRLDFWKKEEEVVNQRIERKEQRLQSAKNEIYQLLGIYFVFQGVILTALAQANDLSEKWRWIPFVLSTLASMATILALVYKLRDCSELERQIKGEKLMSKALFQASDDLKSMGSAFDHKDVQRQPHITHRPQDRPKNLIPRIWEDHMKAYGALLVVILLIFSTIMGIACWQITSSKN